MRRSRSVRMPLVASLVLGLAMGLFVAGALTPSDTRAAVRVDGGGVKDGGILKIGIPEFNAIDPALTLAPNTGAVISAQIASVALGDATCALLFRYPVARPPAIRYDLVPEVAAGYPEVSPDGRTYTFTIRKGYRFSTGAPVTAGSYAAAINRDLNPKMDSPAAQYLRDIVGAHAVQQGRASTASGVKVAGSRLIVELTKRAPDFPARMTTPYFCPVPPGLEVDPEGAGAPFPGSGRYYVAEFVKASRVFLARNPFYRGPRAHHLDGLVFQVEDAGATIVPKVESGELDLALGFTNPQIDHLVPKYGVNKSRYFTLPSPVMFYLHMNTSRPLFRHNVKLRRAVSFAIDRTALAEAIGKTAFTPTGDYLPTGLPGSVDGHVYPLHPDLAKARALARGHTKGGTAVAYTCLDGGTAGSCLATYQIVRENLKLIGIDVQIQQFPNSIEITKESTRGEPFDIAGERYDVPWVDPYEYVNLQLDGRTIRATGNTNVSYFNSARYNKLIDRAGSLSGRARDVAYGRLALDIVKNAAPMAAYANRNSKFFVSGQVGCVTAGAHNVDLAGLCLK